MKRAITPAARSFDMMISEELALQRPMTRQPGAPEGWLRWTRGTETSGSQRKVRERRHDRRNGVAFRRSRPRTAGPAHDPEKSADLSDAIIRREDVDRTRRRRGHLARRR